MEDQYKPLLKYAIITSEYNEDTRIFREVLTHIFYGDTIDEIQDIIAAHRKTDAFFNGSFLGYYDDIKLRNEIVGLI